MLMFVPHPYITRLTAEQIVQVQTIASALMRPWTPEEVRGGRIVQISMTEADFEKVSRYYMKHTGSVTWWVHRCYNTDADDGTITSVRVEVFRKQDL